MSRILTTALLLVAAFIAKLAAQPDPLTKPTDLAPKQPSSLKKALGLIDIQSFTPPEELVRDWIIGGDCFDVTNVKFKGSPAQFGHFLDGQSIIGMDQGAILSTGLVDNGIGPNDEDLASWNFGGKEQDIQLLALSAPGGLIGPPGGGIGGGGNPQTFDLAEISFDFTPTVTPITFQYVFASEEYCERNFDTFDDRVGFFVKGPGVTGIFGGYANLMQIPPVVFPYSYVGVATLNNVDNANIFRNNQPPINPNPNQPPPPTCSPGGNTSVTTQALEYDGFSATLTTITANFVPCQTYNVRLKIADVGDNNGDSAVFLKASGFSSGNKGRITTAVDGDPDNNIAVESCDQGQFIFERINPDVTTSPVTVTYAISGTATAGVDYQPIPPVVTIPAGQVSVTVPLNIIPDALLEGDESVRLTVTNPCSCLQPYQEIIIRDYVPMTVLAPEETQRCGAGPVDLEAFVFDGDEPYTYKWSNGMTDGFISPFTQNSTTYKVTVTDDCGKTAVASFPVTIRPLPKATTGGTATLCKTGPDKVSIPITLTGIGPWTVNYTYNSAQQSVGGIGSSPFYLDVTEAGVYKLTEVIDEFGCEGTATGTYVVVADEVNLAGVPFNVHCFGNNDGSINTTAKDGVEPYFYSWSPNLGNVADPQNLGPGQYKVTVTDQKGCTNKDSFNITQPPIIALAQLEVTEANCKNPSGGTAAVSASGGAGGFSFVWNNGQTSSVATGLAQGTYSVTATDQTGCTKALSVNVPGNFAGPTASAFANGTVTCGNQNVPLLGNGSSTGGQFSYLWSGGSFSGPVDQLNATAIAPGFYTLLVTNIQNGCTATAGATVTGNVVLPDAAAAVSGEINCATAQVNVLGNGSSTGGNFTYEWSGPGLVGSPASLNLQANQPGFYQLKVTNTVTGCINTAGVNVVGNFAQPTATAAAPQKINCKNASVPLNGTAGNGTSFTYQWTTADGQITGGGSSADATAGAIGTYNLLVTNTANGCTNTATATVEQTLPPVASIASSQNVLCFGGNSGSATASATLGDGNYSYLWSDGQATASAQNLPAGQISVVITDGDGCTSTASTTLSQPAELSVTTSSTGQSIVGAMDGTASASSAGGTAGYTFVWSNGQSGSTITGLEPGDYSVTSTDANGCTAVGTTIVAVAPCQLSINGTVDNVKCFGFADGAITVDLVNETGNSNFVWSNSGSGAQITGLVAGNYTVSATDDNGCTLVQTYIVSQPPVISIIESHENVACPDDTNGSAVLTVTGGVGGYTYNWSTGSTQPFETNLGVGLYTVGVTDANGCLTAGFVEIEAVDNVPPVLVLNTPTFAIDDNGKATLVVADFDGGSADNCGIGTWEVTPKSFDCTQLGLQEVTLTVTDLAGNTTVQTAQCNIIDNKAPVLTCPTDKETWSCTPIVSYAFPVAIDNCLGNGGQFALVSGLSSGEQYPLGVTINKWSYTDAGGNVGTCEFKVTVHELPVVNADPVQPLCKGDCNGTLTALPTGGKGPFTYLWDNGQTADKATALCAGNHSVTITDGGGCVGIHSFFLGEPVQLTASLVSKVDDIGSAGIGAITVSASGGTPNLTYEWTKDGAFFSNSQNLTGLKTGNYVLKVTDANGCVVELASVFVDDLVSAGEPDWATGMTLSPNPTSGQAEVRFKNFAPKRAQIDIFDANGRLVQSLLFEKQQPVLPVDLMEKPAGVYQLRIIVDGSAVARQLVKQ